MIIIRENNEENDKIEFKLFDIQIINNDGIQENVELSGDEFETFVLTMMFLFQDNGFKVLSESESPNEDSESKYYNFIKVIDNKMFKALVKIRVSDHKVPDRIIDGELISHDKHMTQLMKQRSQKIAKSYGQTRGYKYRYLDFIMNGTHYFSYEDVLNDIKKYLQHCK